MDGIIFSNNANKIYQQGHIIGIKRLLADLPPLITKIEYDPTAITLLDEYLSNLMDTFTTNLSHPQLPFEPLCRLLKATNKYLNLRGLVQQQVEWGQALLSYFLDHPESAEDIDIAILAIIASGFERLGQLEDAIDLYEDIIALFDDDLNNPNLGAVYYNMALAYHKQENFASAIEACEHAIRIDTHYQDNRAVAITRMLLADLHFSLGDKRAGFGNMKQAITVIEHLNNPSILALYTGKLAFFMARYDNFEKAIPLFQSAITQWELLGDKEQLGLVMFNYAVLLQETNRSADAYRYAYDSLRLFEALNHPHEETVKEAMATWENEGHSTT